MKTLLLGQCAPRHAHLSTSVIPNWEPLALFACCGASQSQPETAASRSDARFTVLYLGNAGQGHRFETAVEAADMLRDDSVRFLFVGGGSKWEWLERAKDDHSLRNIVLRGYVPKGQTPEIMRSADCALVTLRDEMLGAISPSKIHSNLAMGLPLIYVGPRDSNVDEAISRYHCGVSLRHGDALGVTRFIRALAGSPAVRQEYARRSRKAFNEAYCDAKTLPTFDAMIDAVLVRKHDGRRHEE